MKKILILTISTIFMILMLAPSAFALSGLAEDFIRACTALDAPFPPENWSKDDLRVAALEVLDATENGSYDTWPRPFCLKTLGFVQNPDDLPRILAYEEKMNYTVLSALKGFSHPDAIDYLLKYVTNDKAPKRELAIKGLAEMDFRKFDKPEIWKDKVKNAIKNALNKEKVGWLKEDMKNALSKVEKAKIK